MPEDEKTAAPVENLVSETEQLEAAKARRVEDYDMEAAAMPECLFSRDEIARIRKAILP